MAEIDTRVAFIDLEVDAKTKKALDFGVVRDDVELHTSNPKDFLSVVNGAEYICGHNILAHDINYLPGELDDNTKIIDTLTLSPLLFPERPYHKLVKDDKLQVDEVNNPLNDSIKARDLFYDEVNAFQKLDVVLQRIYRSLLVNTKEFFGFFKFVKSQISFNLIQDIKRYFNGIICQNADIEKYIKNNPVELAYALALIQVNDKHSITPPWVYINYPITDNIIHILRGKSCNCCNYCKNNLDIHKKLKQMFGYDKFREYNNEPLQEMATQAAVDGKSILAIFPTGGGKSLTFQLPALIAGENSKSLTVVISPLQSLMKDQVDNLAKKGIVDAVAINGLLSPIERAEAINRVLTGIASILYISPESLRSRTIENLLMSRSIERFVIDEAHCFSAWGHDFRVDYMYIGDFIKKLKEKKGLDRDIPISCFTATAKQKVVLDIKEYFKEKLNLELELYATDATRKNLQYIVLFREKEEEKYQTLRDLIEAKDCSTIVYVSRTGKTEELAEKLTRDGFPAKAFNGKMSSDKKVENQNSFLKDNVKIMVATSAFGMGVDKSDVKLVIHYDISDSLENYVQEAGRAGRNQEIQAECYVLFNNDDLDKLFIRLNQNKLSLNEIQQVWRAIKEYTKYTDTICKSPLEIARKAGWRDDVADIETRVKTAVSALENAGYIERGRNVPRIFASGLSVSNMEQAARIIDSASTFTEEQKTISKRIIKMLISRRSRQHNKEEDAESRVDYISDRLGLDKRDVITCINLMKEKKILEDTVDLVAKINKLETKQKFDIEFQRYIKVERFLIAELEENREIFNYREVNDKAIRSGLDFCTTNKIKKIINYWTISGYIQKQIDSSEDRVVKKLYDLDKFKEIVEKRADIAKFIIKYLTRKAQTTFDTSETKIIGFTILELQREYAKNISLFSNGNATTEEIQNALLFLNKMDILNLEGGILVTYNSMEIHRITQDNKIKYKIDDYKKMSEYYKQKIQQIHIIGEYARMMVSDYQSALQFVNDYFQMNYEMFLKKYFKGNRLGEINRNITPQKYDKLFSSLSPIQREIVDNNKSQYITVAAGPGSGKTRVLVHKLASLLLMEDVKHEQLLMLTFSRAAASEFKSRLLESIGNAAHYVEIKTFHSYCFDLLGKIGNIEDSKEVVKKAAEMIESGEVEAGKITKTVLVIDEAQDMDENEYALLNALIKKNEDMRVIAVGDDDQNIYEFRGSKSVYFDSLSKMENAKRYEMTDNYRSGENLVRATNQFLNTIQNRTKTTNIKSVNKCAGFFKVVKHTSNYFEEAIVAEVANNRKNGTTCILTGTNDDAVKINGLLTKNGIKSKLIQSIDGFDLSKLKEMKYFLFLINLKTKTPTIDNEVWDSAIDKLKSKFKNSTCLDNCLEILSVFEKNSKSKYRTDLEEFIFETNFEDYIKCEEGVVLVSTIHKSKGREFDNVYIYLNKYMFTNDSSRRPVYVGMTRAKKELHIHYSGNEFDRYRDIADCFEVDSKEYNEPQEIVVQGGYRDVYLDYFKLKKYMIKDMVSGDELQIQGEYLLANYNGELKPVGKLSQNFYGFINDLKEKGYIPISASIRFIVMWKSKTDNDDYGDSMIILPDIKLVKQK